MKSIYKNFMELIGNTPAMELSNIEKNHKLNAIVVGKLEYFNPAGSVKDRVARSMIEDAEARGILKSGSTIIEPTSGNTGIGIAAISASKGYKVILTMPDSMSIERRNLLAAYGAKIVLTDGKLGMKGAIDKAYELSKTISDSYIPGQFENPANPEIHRLTTGVEIWNQTNGEIDIFVAGVGTGGTITGVGEYLKQQKSTIQIVAVEPANSPVLSGGKSGSHGLQGIGAGFIPKILNTNIFDEIICVENDQAYATGREIAQTEGILVGISSGASVWAAIKLAERQENQGKMIVALLPDTGERYLSSPMFTK